MIASTPKPVAVSTNLCLLLCLLALAPSLHAQENILDDLLVPYGGALPPSIRTDETYANVVDQVVVEDDAFLIDNEEVDPLETISFATTPLPALEVGQNYLLSVEVNIEQMELASSEGIVDEIEPGLRIYYYQTDGNGHVWALFTGSGATDGWVKAILPINTANIPEMSNGYVLITLRQTRGKIRFRNFRLEPVEMLPSESPFFVLPDGGEIAEQVFRL